MWNAELPSRRDLSQTVALGGPVHSVEVPNQLSTLRRCSCGIAVQTRRVRAYNEDAFQYFLALERERSRRSGRPFLLLLVDAREPADANVPFDRRVARTLFRGLARCVRETDVIGWYRHRHVAAVLLTELGDRPRGDAADLVRRRIDDALRQVLPSSVIRRLRVRLSRHPELLPGELACSS